MYHIVLFEPEIPPNTGNIIRLCANCGFNLHLIHPLGFVINDKQLRRAGLDYHNLAVISEYKNFTDFYHKAQPERLFAIETCGAKYYHQIKYQTNDYLLFGAETRGLPPWLLDKISSENIIKIPMQNNIRSINLSNAVAIVAYEAWRQTEFAMTIKN